MKAQVNYFTLSSNRNHVFYHPIAAIGSVK